MSQKTKPEVFIIESLNFENERDEEFEGQIIKKILSLSGKQCQYFYVRTKREFREILKKFTKSEYRYLHLSCHGNENTLATTLDRIPFSELAKLLNPHLSERRLFVSACSMTNEALAQLIMPSDCYSILGPDQSVNVSDAAVLWASLYHVMFAADVDLMKGKVLRTKAQEVANMFRVRLRYFGRDRSEVKGYVGFEIDPAAEDLNDSK